MAEKIIDWAKGGKGKIWKAKGENSYIVQTRMRDMGDFGRMDYGRLVHLGNLVGEEEPVDTIETFLPYWEFQAYDGDPQPIVEYMLGNIREDESKLKEYQEP